MTADQPADPTMAAIVTSLAETCTDDGIAIWLFARHSGGKLGGSRPIDLCRTVDGRRRVLDVAESLTGMVAT